MAIELRVDNTGMGEVVVACVHCGGEIADAEEGVAVWMPSGEPDPAEGTVFCVDYAHRACEERFQERHCGPDASKVLQKINLPLPDLLDAVRGS